MAIQAVVEISRHHALPRYMDAIFIAVFFATLAGTLLVATVTYRLIEQPSQRLGKKLIRDYL